MSKSRGNVVGAIEMAEKYGCDTGRLYTLFAAPPEKDLEWSEEAIEGSARFLKKVYRLVTDHADRLRAVQTDLTQQTDLTSATAKEKLLVRKVHQTLKRITNDFEVRWHFNTSVSLLMTLVNEIHAQEPLDVELSPMILKRALEMLLLMLSPMAPHICGRVVADAGAFDQPGARELAAVSRRFGARRAVRGNHSDQRAAAREDLGGRRFE